MWSANPPYIRLENVPPETMFRLPASLSDDAGRSDIYTVLTMHDVDAFEDDVSAYPAVVVLKNGPQRRAVVAEAAADFGESQARTLSRWVRRSPRSTLSTPSVEASRLDTWFDGGDLWPAGSPAHLAHIADLARPSLRVARARAAIWGAGLVAGGHDLEN